MLVNNVFLGKIVVVTGKLDNYSRSGIQSGLLKLGAHPTSNVSRKTDYIIVGARAGIKLDRAKALGIMILSEKEFEDMVG